MKNHALSIYIIAQKVGWGGEAKPPPPPATPLHIGKWGMWMNKAISEKGRERNIEKDESAGLMKEIQGW